MQNLSYRQPSAKYRAPSLALIILLHVLFAWQWSRKLHLRQYAPPSPALAYLDLRMLPAPVKVQPVAIAPLPASRTPVPVKGKRANAHTEVQIITESPHSTTSLEAQPTAPAMEAPTLNLDSLRQQAYQNEKSREKGHMDVLQNEQLQDRSLEAKLNDGARRAQRTDCRAYAGAGLLAPLVAVADVARGKPCKW